MCYKQILCKQPITRTKGLVFPMERKRRHCCPKMLLKKIWKSFFPSLYAMKSGRGAAVYSTTEGTRLF